MTGDDLEFLEYVERHMKHGDGRFSYASIMRLYGLAEIPYTSHDDFESATLSHDIVFALSLKARMIHTKSVFELIDLVKSITDYAIDKI